MNTCDMNIRGKWKRAALMSAVSAVSAVLLGASAQPAIASPPAHARGHEACTVTRTVEPYQPIEVGLGEVMALLPENAPNYVFAQRQHFEQALEDAKQGDGVPVRPGRISGAFLLEPEFAALGGGWRTDQEPCRITVEVKHGDAVESKDAELIRLADADGWGGYYFDGAMPVDAEADQVAIKAYDRRGRVFDKIVLTNEDLTSRADGPATGRF